MLGWCERNILHHYTTDPPNLPINLMQINFVSCSHWSYFIHRGTAAVKLWEGYPFLLFDINIPKILNYLILSGDKYLAWSSMEHRKTSLSGTASPSQSFRLFYRFLASEHRLELWNIKCPLVSTVHWWQCVTTMTNVATMSHGQHIASSGQLGVTADRIASWSTWDNDQSTAACVHS